MSLPVRRQIEQLTQLIDELRKTQQEIIATSRQRTGWLRRAGGGGVDIIHIKTPPAGIPAMTGSSAPYTPGSASCDLLTWNGSTLVTGSGGSVTVYNGTLAAIAGGVPAQARLNGGDYFIDVASCGS